MEVRPHPTHARTTKNIMIGFGIIAVLGWAIAMVIGRHGQNPEIVTRIIFVVVTSGFGIFLLAPIRAYLLICPSCKKLLTKQLPVNITTETRKFCCQRCNVIWDSKVQYEFGGD
ncbi:MAG TPA: hypothetical protein PKL33_05585 [Accumulibacter sp.]|nr:hypothetical protein [Accumulibacter sp.]